MVKNNHGSYYMLMDASWKQFIKAHPETDPTYCLVSQDVEDFLDAEQIGFLCPIITDSDMPPQAMCLILHASDKA